jgi:hypothetical protein
LAVGLPVGRLRRFLSVVSAYALPAVAAWALLGAALGALPVSRPALVLTAAYAVCYGATEVAGRRWPRAPGTSWQVSQTMVVNAPAWRRILIWGSVLGPGFATRNPYAGFWLLPLLVASAGGVRAAAFLGAAVGLAHATGRALALLRDAGPAAGRDPMAIVLASMRWRIVDGVVLLLIAGAAGAALAAS